MIHRWWKALVKQWRSHSRAGTFQSRKQATAQSAIARSYHWAQLLLVVLLCRKTDGFTLKSIITADNPYTPEIDVEAYINSLSDSTDLAGAKQIISRWTFVGCYRIGQPLGAVAIASDQDPGSCIDECDALGNSTAAMLGTTCYCLGAGRSRLAASAAELTDDSDCDIRCVGRYYAGTARHCGGTNSTYSIYQKWTFLNVGAGGCYDPQRLIWYQSVAIELDGGRFEYHLHAASISEGKPLFPYQQPLQHMLLGLQYDFFHSTLVGYSIPLWNTVTDAGKSQSDPWALVVASYNVNTLYQSAITSTRTEHPVLQATVLGLTDVTAFIFGQPVTALNQNHRIYYIVLPDIPRDSDGNMSLPLVKNRLFAVDLDVANNVDGFARLLSDTNPIVALEERIVLMEVNSVTNELFALLQSQNGTAFEYYYTKMGETRKDSESGLVEFTWTFVSVKDSVINADYQDFISKTFQVASSAVDGLSNHSFIVMRDSPSSTSSLNLEYINQDGEGGFLRFEAHPLASPETQGAWLANTDPVIPLDLGAPRILYARYSMNARKINMVLDVSTIRGALPVDVDGDMLPDDVNWTTQHVGVGDCNRMFSQETAEKLGTPPTTTCEWIGGDEIEINLPQYFTTLKVGDALFLKDTTIYAYLAQGNRWSLPASGGITIGVPSPLLLPAITISYPPFVDRCAGLSIDAASSYDHGDVMIMRWSLASVGCLGTIEPTQTLVIELQKKLLDVSADGVTCGINGCVSFEVPPEQLEPGCTYGIDVNLTGRWEVSAVERITITKTPIPAPQVSLLNPRVTETLRDRRITLVTSVEDTSCNVNLPQTNTLRFEWTGQSQGYTPSPTGPVFTANASAVNMSEIVPAFTTSSLVVPKYTLNVDTVYTFRIWAGYAETWNEGESARSYTDAIIYIQRGPLKVNAHGGSRRMRKFDYLAIDTTDSFDSDFPEEVVENSTEWSWTYVCNRLDGTPCFPLINATNAVLTDVQDCVYTDTPFLDLQREYFVPQFTTDFTQSNSSYCRDPNRNGILIINTVADQVLEGNTNYTFTVFAFRDYRQAYSIMELEVLPIVLIPPRIVLSLGGVGARVVVSDTFRTFGALILEDQGKYANSQITWKWHFFKEEPNPAWSQLAFDEAAYKGETYLVPRTILVVADELDRNLYPEFFLTPAGSTNLVLKSGSMSPSTNYNLRLSATVIFEGQELVGWGDIHLSTAGPPPSLGTVDITPANSSYVIGVKTFTATGWNSEDMPMSFMFSYRTDLQSSYSKPVDLRVDFVVATSESVWCMRPGRPEDDFSTEVQVRASTPYGVISDSVKVPYRVLPKEAWQLDNVLILERAEQSDPEVAPIISNCFMLSNPFLESSSSGRRLSTEEALGGLTQEEFTTFIDKVVVYLGVVLANSPITAEVTSYTSYMVRTFLNSLQNIADGGFVTPTMVQFAQTLTGTAKLIFSGEQEIERQALADAAFAAVGQFAVASTHGLPASVATASGININSPTTGAFFPAEGTSTTNNAEGSRRLAAGPIVFSSSDVTNPQAWPYDELVHELEVTPGALDVKGGCESLSGKYQDQCLAQLDGLETELEQENMASTVGLRRLSSVSNSTTSIENIYTAQETLEQEWLLYINATKAQASDTELEELRDKEYFSKYASDLSADERVTAWKLWREEQERLAALKAQAIENHRQVLSQMMQTIEVLDGELINSRMYDESSLEFLFPLGSVRVGKDQSLVTAYDAFTFRDTSYSYPSTSTASYGWELVKFTILNPFAYASNQPFGPFIICALKIFSATGAAILVENLESPVNILADHSSFASATCMYWSWEADSGRGAWSFSGLFNDDNGCTSTHLSIFGMFLEIATPIEDAPSAVEEFLVTKVLQYNTIVALALGCFTAMGVLVQYWAFKQDGSDITKPIESMELGDGVTKPRSYDDPVYYGTAKGSSQMLWTFIHLLQRDHLLVAVFFRDRRLKVTRLQKASVLWAALAGVAAVSALLYGEHVVNPKHQIEIGTLAATITFPMIGMLMMMFASRPAREGTSHGAPATAGVRQENWSTLWAAPVPEDERSEGSEGEMPMAPPNPAPLPPLPPIPPGGRGGPVPPPPKSPTPPRAPFPGAPPSSPPGPRSPMRPALGVSVLPSSAGVPPSPARTAWGNEDANGRPVTSESRRGMARIDNGAGVGSLPLSPPVPPPASFRGRTSDDLEVENLDAIMPGAPTPALVPPVPPPARQDSRLSEAEPEASELALPPTDELAVTQQPLTQALDLQGPTVQSQSYTNMLRRVRRMYVEKALYNSERLAYDERLDIKTSASLHIAHLARVMAFMAVACYWIVAMVLATAYAVHFSTVTAWRWCYSCMAGWCFTWCVLELVRVVLETFLEIAQLYQRQSNCPDQLKLESKVAAALERKDRQMAAAAANVGTHRMFSLVPAPPLPAEPAPLPGLGDESAG